jgi:aldehyde:ferredoxin oxidoreductase
LNWNREDYFEWLFNSLDVFNEIKGIMFSFPKRSEGWNHQMITKWYSDLASIYDSLGFCLFSSLHLGPKYYSELYSNATGFEVTPRELMKTGERIFNLGKAFMVREGFRRKDDKWPKLFYEEPALKGPAKGKKLDEKRIDQAIDKYYKLRGWDKRTGKIKREKLIELGLDYVL